MVRVLMHWLVNAVSFYIVALLVPGFNLASFGSAVVVALVFSLLSVLLGPLLTIIGTLVSLPLVLGTFGLFYFVIRFVVYLFLLGLTAHLASGFYIAGTGALVVGAIVLSIVHHLAALLLQPAQG